MEQARGDAAFHHLLQKRLGGARGASCLQGAYKALWVPHPMQLPPATPGDQHLLFWFMVSLAGMRAGHALQHLCLQSLKEDATQLQPHWLAACSSLPTTSPPHLLPQLRDGDSFTTPVPQQGLQGLWGEDESLPKKHLVWGGWCWHRLPKGELFWQAQEHLGGEHSKVLPHPRPWHHWPGSVLQGFTTLSVSMPGQARGTLQPWRACGMVALKVLGPSGASALLCPSLPFSHDIPDLKFSWVYSASQ